MIRRILKFTAIPMLIVVIVASTFAASFLFFKPPSLNFFFERVFVELLLDDPELLTMLRVVEQIGMHFHNNDLTDASDAHARKQLAKVKDDLATLRRYDTDEMTESQRLSTSVLDWFLENTVDGEPFMYHNYPVNQMFGVQSELPTFMATMHQVNTERDAHHYIERLDKFPKKFEQVLNGIRSREEAGIVPPRFIIRKVLDEMRGFVDNGVEANILYSTLLNRLNEKDEGSGKYTVTKVSDSDREALCRDAQRAIEQSVFPAFQTLIDYFTDLEGRASDDAGFWKLPNGEAAYAYALRQNTTTDRTAIEIHRTGLGEVFRILTEMDGILDGLGLEEGTVGERMLALAEDPEMLYPDTDEGRAMCLADYQKYIDHADTQLDAVFDLRPEIGVHVERIPEFKEATAAAYYNPPALDGSRPGIFYAKLNDMKEVPKFTMKTLVYHEAIPGHHFQLALQQEMTGVPTFRKVIPFTAFVEGWALYAEYLAKEMGFYDDDPEGDLGRLQAELFRAVRLVVDTGIHHGRWSREDAIRYMEFVTGMPHGDVVSEIERYIVMPGQACAYKIGQLTFIDLRNRAEQALGEQFDLRDFHNLILSNGAMPLTILEQLIDQYIAESLETTGEGSAAA